MKKFTSFEEAVWLLKFLGWNTAQISKAFKKSERIIRAAATRAIKKVLS